MTVALWDVCIQSQGRVHLYWERPSKVVEKRTLLRSPWLSSIQSQLTWCHTDNGQQRSASPRSCKGYTSEQQKPGGGATQARSCGGDSDRGCVHLGKNQSTTGHGLVDSKDSFCPLWFGGGGIFWHSQQTVYWALALPQALLKAPRPSSGLDEVGQETRGQEVELRYPSIPGWEEAAPECGQPPLGWCP